MKATTGKWTILHLAAALALLVCALGPAGRSAQAATSRFFPETGKTVNDPFLSYWTTHGGLSQQGFPITDAYNEKNDADGKTYLTQYFERARFEYHPENSDPKNQVLLGLLGNEALAAKYGGNPPNSPTQAVPGGGSQTFSQTGKTVTGLFLQYWNTHGGLEQQGFPITDAYNEVNDADGQTYLTQYFERARFEYHPENSNPNAKVLLGLVGREIYGLKQSSGGTGGTTSVPPPPWAGMKIPTPLDTAFIMPFWPSTNPLDAQVVFVKDGKVWTLQLKTGQHTPEDKGILVQNMFPGLAYTNLTSALVWPTGDPLSGTIFLYFHNVYSIFSLGTHQVVGAMPSNPIDPASPLIPGPSYSIATFWPAIDPSFRDPKEGPEAVFVLPASGANKSQGYICGGNGYCLIFDPTAAGYPLTSIANRYTVIWPGLPFINNIDAIVPWPNGKLYFFKGDQYAVVDIATGKVDPGYPRPIN